MKESEDDGEKMSQGQEAKDRVGRNDRFFFALCCLGKIPGGAPFSQLHKSGNGSRVDRP